MATAGIADSSSAFNADTMFGSFVQSRFMPCPDCGSSVERADSAGHRCDPARRLEYQLFRLRDGVAALEDDIGRFLTSPRGRFELWYAARERRRRGS
jgi:hypothetical protein